MTNPDDVVLLDTDVFSYLLKGDKKGDPYRRHVDGKTVAISFVTVGELYYGAYRRWGEKKIAALNAKLKSVVIIPFDVEICKMYAQIKNEAKTAEGTDRVIPANDLWIAACARRHNLPLVSNNRKHFESIPGVRLISEAPSKKPASQEDLKFPDPNAPSPPSSQSPAAS